MKQYSLLILFFILGNWQLYAQKSKSEKLPRHQLIPSFSNAATGIFKGRHGRTVDVNNRIRYGFSGGLEYHVKLKNWFSLGTGLNFISHRYFQTSFSESSVPPPTSLTPSAKQAASMNTVNVLDLPFNVEACTKRKNIFEFRLSVGFSLQIILNKRNKGYAVDYYNLVNTHDRRYSFSGFSSATGIGISIAPAVLIGKHQGLVLQPQFMLIHLVEFDDLTDNHGASKMYFAGLKTGWFFNLN